MALHDRTRFLSGVALAGVLAVASPEGAPAAFQPGRVVDEVLAVVDGAPITRSEVEEAIALNPAASPPPGIAETLETLISARLMEREARRYPLPPPGEEETDRTLAALQDRFPSEAAYRDTLVRLGVREDYLRKRIRRELAVDRYLERRFRPLVQVALRDIEEYYRSVFLPALDTASPPELTEVAPLIRGILVERDLNRRISAWADELRSNARIVRLPLEAPREEGAEGARRGGPTGPGPLRGASGLHLPRSRPG